ncbi:hypothetical protein [Vulcanococcus sp. Clear-D1]|uniref:hypothetical protein n=1 Tax=Vulcanococcus sp. Clear-D1 TaxID=2766970 RepID=UPI0019C6E527|nr:hypothetical protein [Vulcanococcus sp. Clear-D1]MBD1194696.1 hypothetical protein [Vulcanococcus sp. Clear-D1]
MPRITGCCRAVQHPFPCNIVMVGWRVLLMPPSAMVRARPRWLCADGNFSLDQDRALLVVDPAAAVNRLQCWLASKQRPMRYLQRMRLVHSCSIPAAEQRWREHNPISCS